MNKVIGPKHSSRVRAITNHSCETATTSGLYRVAHFPIVKHHPPPAPCRHWRRVPCLRSFCAEGSSFIWTSSAASGSRGAHTAVIVQRPATHAARQ
eukprot:6212422-Pleurochrysis_carterae.AAC.5